MNKQMFDTLYSLAESGDKKAMKRIVGDTFSAGLHTISDLDAGIPLRYLRILADEGDPQSLLTLGSLYYTGFGDHVPQNYAKAMELYDKSAEAAELEDNWALNNLGYCYYYGRNGDVDYRKAYSCFAKAAVQGNPNSMFKLGDMYYHGHHVEKDVNASFYWYSQAKKQYLYTDDDYQDYLVASIAMRMGRAYLFGEGTEVDIVKALRELRLSEELFYKQILMGDSFSREVLPKVKELLQIATEKLDESISAE